MINIEVKDNAVKCNVDGNYGDLLMESLATVRALYTAFDKEPVIKETFLHALHNDIFLDAFDSLIQGEEIKVKEENEAESFLRKFTDALKR